MVGIGGRPSGEKVRPGVAQAERRELVAFLDAVIVACIRAHGAQG